jgi:hypothetical protein
VTKHDTSHPPGKQKLENGNFSEFIGFNFNPNVSTYRAIAPVPRVEIDRDKGKVSLDLASFISEQGLKVSYDASHFSIDLCVALFDWKHLKASTYMDSTELLPIIEEPIEAQHLEVSIEKGCSETIFAAVRLNFHQQVNHDTYVMKNNKYRGLSIVAVDHVAPVKLSLSDFDIPA